MAVTGSETSSSLFIMKPEGHFSALYRKDHLSLEADYDNFVIQRWGMIFAIPVSLPIGIAYRVIM